MVGLIATWTSEQFWYDPETERWVHMPTQGTFSQDPCPVVPLKDASGEVSLQAGYAMWWCPIHREGGWGPAPDLEP